MAESRVNRISLSDAGLGSDIQLIPLVENPFSGTGVLQPLEEIAMESNEALDQEVVPPDFKSSQSFGQFALASSFIEDGHGATHVSSPLSGFIQVAVDRSKNELSTSAEFREVDLLNQETDQATDRFKYSHRDDKLVAAVTSQIYSGPSSKDFSGPCASGYVPYAKSTARTIDECWALCRENFACTQVHFSEIARTCYLSHGISVRAIATAPDDISMPSSECRSLTPAGLETLNRGLLPAFRQIPNNQIYLASNATVDPLTVGSIAECQSACLDADSCQYGAWIARRNGKNECILASMISTSDCPSTVSECVKTCGSEDCALFERNLLNMAGPRSLQAIPATSVSTGAAGFPMNISETPSCEHKCDSTVLSESVCTSLCLVETRSLCQAACASHKSGGCVAVGFYYGGNRTNQMCVGFMSVPIVNSTAIGKELDYSTRLVDVFVMPQSASAASPQGGSLIESGRSSLVATRLSKFLSPEDIRPKFIQFAGPCDVFHEGVLAGGSGPGLTRFKAQSIDECWRLCESYSNNQCSQVQFHVSRGECVLGDAIGKTFKADSSIICRTLEYTPVSSSNGLSGMIYVDSVSGMKNGENNWFSNAAAPVLVDSIEECQALCKLADTGASDAVCRFGGYADCSAFHSTWCQGTGATHIDCGLCDRNPGGGVCRIPKISTTGGVSSSPARQGETPIPCAGGKCKWFERGTYGYSLEVSTGIGSKINHLPQTGLICDSTSYLPTPQGGSAGASGCSYPVESLWHCETLCSTVNKVNGKATCIGGLYSDKQGVKQCKLARFKSSNAKECNGNCGWFELAGEGRTAGLEDTGAGVAEAARNMGTNAFTMGLGPCQQFRAIDAVITNTPSGFQYSPIEDCSRACAYFPQCSSYQITGSVSGNNRDSCDVLKGRESDCTFITCTLSSAISLAVPSGNNMTLCWTKTPLGTTVSGDEDIDMDIDPGIPGYITTNARVRKFGWQDVLNKDQLALTMTMEECQSMCRVSDGCVSGSWQNCQVIEQYCASDSAPGASQELKATCNACRNVGVDKFQQSLQFPEHLGVCKMASVVSTHAEGCWPEPCYAFEEGSENFFIMSTSKSGFLLPDGSIDKLLLNYQGEPSAYVKAKSLSECEDACGADDQCKYGHYVPRTTGYGECYLTSQEIRVNDGQRFRMKDPQPCEGQCIAFMKLPIRLPKNMFAPTMTANNDAPEMMQPQAQITY
jgi:hypothetical protein